MTIKRTKSFLALTIASIFCCTPVAFSADAIDIQSPPPQIIASFGIFDINEGATVEGVSQNPLLPMSIVDSSGEAINERIAILEDSPHEIRAVSEIFLDEFPEKICPDAEWTQPAGVTWVMDDLQTKTSQVADSTNQRLVSGLKNPGEFLLSCFVDRNYKFKQKGQEYNLTALSSRGIGFFVADITPPEFDLIINDKEQRKTVISFKESPPNQPYGKKTYDITFLGQHFSPGYKEMKSGVLRGQLDLKNNVDLTDFEKFPQLYFQKEVQFLLKVQAQDNFKVDSTSWEIVDQAGRALFGQNPDNIMFPTDRVFIGRQYLLVKSTDKAQNFIELKIPLRIGVEKE
ncbi:MAG: hypothetical protein HQM10_05145 [Candidatus Riflebacteria bacterium]|nr:hypothetical protein [Candidatus Riflebacteria bacterium]